MTSPSPRTQRTSVFQVVVAPLQAFFRLEAAGGIALAAAAALALIWANSPWAESYRALVEYPMAIGLGGHLGEFTLHALVNDGLMTVFFFLVGMEIKRELAAGELRTVSKALLPLIAAAGGMIVPAAIYFAFNRGTPAAAGWGIPMATDIAFAIGCLTLLKGRVSHPLVVFLTALAIFDDLGGILVIAIFYGSGIQADWLLISAALGLVLLGFNRLYVKSGAAYLLVGAALWYAVHHSGIHATIAGVILGLAVPARSKRPAREVLVDLSENVGQAVREVENEELDNARLLSIEETIEDLEPPLNRFEHALHPWVAFAIVPFFALINSGISLEGMSVSNLLDPVPLGIALGLFVGKQLGITAFTLAAVKANVSPMPGDARAMVLHGVSIVAGIGFTVALFIAELAFVHDRELLDEAKLGILVGSALSGLVGFVWLRAFGAKPAAAPA